MDTFYPFGIYQSANMDTYYPPYSNNNQDAIFKMTWSSILLAGDIRYESLYGRQSKNIILNFTAALKHFRREGVKSIDKGYHKTAQRKCGS